MNATHSFPTLRARYRPLLIGLALVLAQIAPVQAAPLYGSFSGTVNFISTCPVCIDPTTFPNGGIDVGTPVSGSFLIDASAPSVEFVTSGVGNYNWTAIPPNSFSVTMNGLTWSAGSSGNPPIDLNIQNNFNYTGQGGPATADEFSLAGRNNDSAQFPAAQNLDHLVLGIDIVDLSATLVSSGALPTSFDISDFPVITNGSIYGYTDDYSQQLGVYFSLDSLRVSTIPEPNSLALVTLGMLALSVAAGLRSLPGKRREERNTSSCFAGMRCRWAVDDFGQMLIRSAARLMFVNTSDSECRRLSLRY